LAHASRTPHGIIINFGVGVPNIMMWYYLVVYYVYDGRFSPFSFGFRDESDDGDIFICLPEDPGKYTKMPDPKTPKFRDFYPYRFGQFLSEIRTTRPPNLIFIQISD
jgi:hypothetical protein